METPAYPRIGVAVLLFDPELVRGGRRPFLVGKRIFGLASELWQFPGGKLDTGETIIQCANRELYEETNLTMDMSTARVYPYVSQEFYPESGEQFVTFYVTGDRQLGSTLLNKEPKKCEEWMWVLDAPKPFWGPIEEILHGQPITPHLQWMQTTVDKRKLLS